MNAVTENAAALAKIGVRTYCCTMGYYNQAGSWIDVRTFTWPELATLLTQHAVGSKEGTCIVPALFTGDRRHNADARQIDVVFLDSDAGTTLQEIADAITGRGWAAAISSTYSHLTTIARARRDAWTRYRDAAGDQATAADFLVAEKGYLPRVAAGARIHSEDAQYVTFAHQPCPKFRIALPLLQPWRAGNYDSQEQANAAWDERIEALAAALRLSHDPACTDTARLFYLPRRPANGPLPETAMLEGGPRDIFALPGAPDSRAARTKSGRLGGKAGTTPGSFVDPETGEIVDLQTWAAKAANQFEIVRALRARRPDIFVGKVSDGIKQHIRCANEDAHTNAGADAATIVIDASQSTNRGFVYHCRHAHCDGTDRLVFLRRMLERGG
ncbi:hypothetical protein [Dankookia sp. P2]|uniref:hypothetical protein n=1 Tax=Dankookia sp. P2 TaxID=3423955 RepID=UPI003D679989